MLIDHGADSSIPDKYGRTAMELRESINLVNKRTVVITDDVFLHHHTCDPNAAISINAPPENKHRIEVVIDPLNGILRGSDLPLVWEESSPRADMADVLRVHDWSYVRKVQGTCEGIPIDELGRLDGDTTLSTESFEAALHAAGAVCRAIDLVIDEKSEVQNAFCAIRPPGHHSGPKGVVPSEHGSDSHGFCLLNNIAIGASYALHVHRKTIKRVAIIDFDVHHGNGTEECVRWLRPGVDHAELTRNDVFGAVTMPRYKPWLNDEDTDNVLFVSVHGYGPREKGLEHLFPYAAFYPGSGKTQYPLLIKKKNDNLVVEGKGLPSKSVGVGLGDMEEMEAVTGVEADENGNDHANLPQDNEQDEDEDDDEDNDDDDFEEEEEEGSYSDTKHISGSNRLMQLHAMYTNDAVSAFSDSLILDIGVPLANEDIESDSLAAASYRNYWRNQFRDEIFPRLISFEPDLLLISAGFDAHKKVYF